MSTVAALPSRINLQEKGFDGQASSKIPVIQKRRKAQGDFTAALPLCCAERLCLSVPLLFLNRQGYALPSARLCLADHKGGMSRKAIGFPHSRAAAAARAKHPQLFKSYFSRKA
jgi:hypothetical protein